MVHQFDNIDHMFAIFPDNQETFNNEIHVELERLTIDLPTHNLDHFLGQFKISSLETQIIGRRDIENEAEIDMHNVALFLVD